jgi:cytochrome P450
VGANADAVLAELFTPRARENPYPIYAALRGLGPVSPLAPGRPGSTPFAAVAVDFEPVDAILRDPNFYKRTAPERWDHPVLRTFDTSMMFTNPPDHGRMRRVFQREFTTRRLDALRPTVAEVVETLLDRMAARGADGSALDLVAAYAIAVPTLVMAAFLGFPEEDAAWYRGRVDLIDAYLDLDGKTPERLAAADEAAAALRAYYADLLDRRRRDPRADLISALVRALDAGEREITEDELVSNLVILFNASFVTTVYLLSGGVPLLLARPDLAAALPDDAELARGCVREILRYESPVQFLTRTARRATAVAGVPIPADGTVLLLLGAANRDPRRFADPDAFDPRRPDTGSLAFGAGPHFCLGAAVARLEGEIALRRLFARFPGLAAAGEPAHTGSLFLRGIDALPVTVAPPAEPVERGR